MRAMLVLVAVLLAAVSTLAQLPPPTQGRCVAVDALLVCAVEAFGGAASILELRN